MSERDAIARAKTPATVDSLAEDLRRLGLEPAATVLVHTSLSALGWVCGGAVAVIEALFRVLGSEGTLVMPAQSGGLTDPAHWQDPPVPEEWKPTIRATMPAYDPGVTPTRQMGAVAEAFRVWPGTIRSDHPHVSFAARGLRAEAILADHILDYGLGETSPLARIYDLGGQVLLLGVGHEANTSMHLAEYRTDYPGRCETVQGAPILVDGVRAWCTLRDIDIRSEDFVEIGAAFERETDHVRRGAVGAGLGRRMPMRELVDYAGAWMQKHREAQPRRADS